MWILDRKDLGKAVLGTFGAAAIFGLAVYFQGNIAAYIGETGTKWVLIALLLLICWHGGIVVKGWLFVRDYERHDREMKADDKRQAVEWELQKQEEREEWDALANWVNQNPVRAERLMQIVDSEQIQDPEHRAWIAERRKNEGPNALTDMSRLFDWLKARRDLKKAGLNPDPDLPS